MVVALYCAVTLCYLGQDAAPSVDTKPPVPKIEKSKSVENAKLPFPFPGVTVVPVMVDSEEEDTSLLFRVNLPLFWQTLSSEEQKSVKKLPQLMDLVRQRLQPPAKKHEPKTIMPSQFV